ncbi:tyrosine-type recombinase/integrase [Amycolatopsis thermophila]|uniref:Integrase/DNA-binding transcriptional regulator YhcF (GntR family) n=1 Tax=Amycolatopsis thermophila TaxID=206084 RepID=A0ABU0EUV2_9PSEU|nr:tyrosine-type recombinase/integrase [Amycolatopsis thermophila]MDQ0379063.1 integrase/DNA-binding transcriptional regulator YhcF (GntR family) [Amycolatopsis thermophila]
MTTAGGRAQKRSRGQVEKLPSGALRVKVYAGVDPLSGKRHYLRETVPAGPQAEKEAEKVRIRLVNEVNERRNPRTSATVNQLMDRYLELLHVDTTTRQRYESVIRTHIRPLLGKQPLSRLDGETFDSFYKILRTCRTHCGGRRFIEHGVAGEHECTDKCRVHKCKPLSDGTIRKIHWCLSGALKDAMRWKWITVNPLDQADAPSNATPDPQPPTPDEAAAIVNEAFKDLRWGMFVWLAMTTGARRGELCALRWDRLDLDNAVIWIRSSIAQDGAKTWEKDTKTHQQRRIALNAETVGLLRAYRQHCEAEAQIVGTTIEKTGRVFSPSVDHSTWLKPSSVSQRYRRMCEKLGWDMHLHQLRHYSATELIASGVDVRTVAGRLGHGGGGATTLRVYSAWVAEADQKAAGNFTARMPQAPIVLDIEGNPRSTLEPETANPYQKIATDLRGAITAGVLRTGDRLPPVTEIAGRYHVSVGTAHRAIAALKDAGLVIASRGRPAVVANANSANGFATVTEIESRKTH